MISGVALCFVAFIAYIAWRNARRHTLKDIRGPPSPSFWLGKTHSFQSVDILHMRLQVTRKHIDTLNKRGTWNFIGFANMVQLGWPKDV
jgi:hypothetical protein